MTREDVRCVDEYGKVNCGMERERGDTGSEVQVACMLAPNVWLTRAFAKIERAIVLPTARIDEGRGRFRKSGKQVQNKTRRERKSKNAVVEMTEMQKRLRGARRMDGGRERVTCKAEARWDGGAYKASMRHMVQETLDVSSSWRDERWNVDDIGMHFATIKGGHSATRPTARREREI